MSNLTFHSIYNATKETLKTARKPFVFNKNKRAIESAIDSANEQKINAEDTLNKELEVVAKGEVINVNKILAYRETMRNAEETIKELKEFKKEFLGE